ncbi:helix-turn-helix domain-containing protein [bacterium]|nr:helix-turn-helix domain-containing protein [bacterium]
MRKIGLYLRERREKLGLKQITVAKSTGKTSAYLNKVEKGESTPTPAYLEKISVPLELDFVDVYLQSMEDRDLPEILREEIRSFRSLRPLLLPGMPVEQFIAFTKQLSPENVRRILLIVETIYLMTRQSVEKISEGEETKEF